jgi:hypothetical protein
MYSSTYPPSTLIYSYLFHRFSSASKPAAQKSLAVVSATSAPPFHHLRFSNVLDRIYRLSRESLYATNTSHHRYTIFLYEYPLHWILLLTNKHNRTSLSVVHPQVRSPFWLLKAASEYAHERLLPRLSWSWIMLLPSDTHWKHVTSITAVLLPFVTHLLTLPHTCHSETVENIVHVNTGWIRKDMKGSVYGLTLLTHMLHRTEEFNGISESELSESCSKLEAGNSENTR